MRRERFLAVNVRGAEMDVGTIERAWPIYRQWTTQPGPPPEGIWVFEGDRLLLGSGIFPMDGIMLVTGIITDPDLTDRAKVRVLRFFLSVLEGHQKVTQRALFVDMVWTENEDGLLERRVPTLSGTHVIAETEIPSPGTAEDSDGGGETGPAKGLEAAPTTVASSVEPAPKEPKKARAAKKKASKKRKAGEK